MNGVIGDVTAHAFLHGMGWETCYSIAPNIPAPLFIAFGMMFALMTPVLPTGAFAEKLTMECFIIFVTVWPILVYYPLAHWIWHPDGWLHVMGVSDFAGGLVIHGSSGIAGLVCAAMLQPRRCWRELADTHHNLGFVATGTALVLCGWYSFNGGSAYGANAQAARALLSTHVAACSGALSWLAVAWWQSGRKYFSLKGLCSGFMAGLASITAGSGYVWPGFSAPIGCVAGVLSYLTVQWVTSAGIDDVLDVMALQGTPGIVGMLAVGLMADSDTSTGLHGLLVGGGWRLLGVQTLALVVGLAWAAAGTFLIMIIMIRAGIAEVDAETEVRGLDRVQCGEFAYDLDERGQPVITTLEDAADSARKLRQAAASGELRTVQLLLAGGACSTMPDHRGRAALHCAAREGHAAVVKLLLADPGVEVNARDMHGHTPLHDAVTHGHDFVAELLRHAGGVLPHDESGEVALLAAAAANDVLQVQRLLRRGVDPRAADYDNRTALMVAACFGHAETVQALLEFSADPMAKDRWGDTARVSAERRGVHGQLLQLLSLAELEFIRSNSEARAHQPTLRNRHAAPAPRMLSREHSLNMPLLVTQSGPGDDTDGMRPWSRAESQNLLPIFSQGETGGQLVVSPRGVTRDSADLLVQAVQQRVHAWRSATHTPSPRESFALLDVGTSSNGSVAGSSQGRPHTTQNDTNVATLLEAAASGDVEELQRLVARNSKPLVKVWDETDGSSLAHIAAVAGHISILQALKELGGMAALNLRDHYGTTARAAAVLRGDAAGRTAHWLAAQGALCRSPLLGHQLCACAAAGDVPSLLRWAEWGADLGTPDYDQRTCAHLAACEGHIGVVEYLLSKQVDMHQTDLWGHTPADDARSYSHTAIEQLVSTAPRESIVTIPTVV